MQAQNIKEINQYKHSKNDVDMIDEQKLNGV